MRLSQRAAVMLILALGFVLTPVSSFGAGPEFTKAQAGKGRQAYREHCATCHGAKLEGIHLAPGLTGSRFDTMWRGKSAETLAYHVRRMPPPPAETSGNLGTEMYSDIVSYILIENDFEAGDVALPSEMAALAKLSLPRLKGMDYDPDVPVSRSPEQEQLLADLSPVTNRMLENPSPNDWLQWGGGYTGWSYSPLSSINRDNVGQLTAAWRAPIRQGPSMTVPLVHDGVMFIHTFPDTVLALDASNGNVLWRYRREGIQRSTTKTGIALHGDKVFVPTSDKHMVALHAKTGDVIWEKAVAPTRSPYSLRAAPMVVGDKVIQGVTATRAPKGGYIFALDIETGEERWRFNTIARPGEPGGDTWNDVPLERRSGGSVWHQYTYDKELNLLYFGAAPTYDTGPLVHPVDKEGVSSEALFTNCTVALDADTGQMAWWYQHMENDQWDLDWVFERQIVTLNMDGKPRKVVMNMGKMCLLDALDAATGQYLFSIDSGTQDVVIAIDPRTGAKTIDPSKWPNPDEPCDVCPNPAGARSWPPTAYSPETNYVYVPIMEWCMRMGDTGMSLLSSGVKIETIPHPDNDDGMLARLQAMDLEKQGLAWAHNQVEPMSTSVLTTGGGVLFVGDMEPSLNAFDEATGERLWQAKLDAIPSSSVITYRIGDQQYVAVVVGFETIYIDTLLEARQGFLDDDFEVPAGGNSVWVFSVPTSQ